MRFFVPKADADQAEQTWQGTRDFLIGNGFKISQRRVYEIHYPHNGDDLVATVGGREPLTRGLVLMIFEGPTFLICTPRRGVPWVSEVPVLVGVPDRVIDFDSANAEGDLEGASVGS